MIWLASIGLRETVRAQGLGETRSLSIFLYGEDQRAANVRLSAWIAHNRFDFDAYTLRVADIQDLSHYPLPEHIIGLPRALIPFDHTRQMH